LDGVVLGSPLSAAPLQSGTARRALRLPQRSPTAPDPPAPPQLWGAGLAPGAHFDAERPSPALLDLLSRRAPPPAAGAVPPPRRRGGGLGGLLARLRPGRGGAAAAADAAPAAGGAPAAADAPAGAAPAAGGAGAGAGLDLDVAGRTFFVPGCGRGYDVLAAAAAGAARAVGLDLAPDAVAAARAHASAAAAGGALPGGAAAAAAAPHFVAGDFFTYSDPVAGAAGGFDFGYDYTFL
jgi:hypothetical protein